jgi:two-component system response regulator HydG
VLIVDDDESHAEAVAESLERLGKYECTVANSGARGSALIESDTFDVVVTDLRMNDVDGLAILRKTKDELPDAEGMAPSTRRSPPCSTEPTPISPSPSTSTSCGRRSRRPPSGSA